MRSIDMRYAAGAALLALAQPAAADVLVVRSNGPSAARYAPGHSLPDSARIALQKGDQVVLLDTHGTRVLTGPGQFSVTGGPAAAAPSALAALAGNATQRRTRVGAVRNLPDGTNARPNIFFVDIAAPGPMCVADPATVQLWRGKADSTATATIAGDDGASATIRWIKGQSTQPWPAALPVAEGRSYRLVDPAGAATALRFETLDPPPTDLNGLASSLIARGCKAQVDVLIAATTGS